MLDVVYCIVTCGARDYNQSRPNNPTRHNYKQYKNALGLNRYNFRTLIWRYDIVANVV